MLKCKRVAEVDVFPEILALGGRGFNSTKNVNLRFAFSDVGGDGKPPFGNASRNTASGG